MFGQSRRPAAIITLSAVVSALCCPKRSDKSSSSISTVCALRARKWMGHLWSREFCGVMDRRTHQVVMKQRVRFASQKRRTTCGNLTYVQRWQASSTVSTPSLSRSYMSNNTFISSTSSSCTATDKCRPIKGRKKIWSPRCACGHAQTGTHPSIPFSCSSCRNQPMLSRRPTWSSSCGFDIYHADFTEPHTFLTPDLTCKQGVLILLYLVDRCCIRRRAILTGGSDHRWLLFRHCRLDTKYCLP